MSPSHSHSVQSEKPNFEYHDNTVIFTFADYKGGLYHVTALSIPNGQDPDVPPRNFAPDDKTLNDVSGGGSLTFSVGRHLDGGPASFFNQGVKSTENTFNKDAQQLNFAFSGTLTLKTINDAYIIDNVYLGQGHDGSANNWWFGIKGAVQSGTPNTIQFKTIAGQVLQFQRGALVTSDNQIKVSRPTLHVHQDYAEHGEHPAHGGKNGHGEDKDNEYR